MADILPQISIPQISIRRATPADADKLAALSAATFIDTFVHGFGIDYPQADLDAFIAKSHSPAAYAEWLADPEVATWIAEDADGSAVGYALVGSSELPVEGVTADDGEIHRLYVAKPAQGSGLAGRLTVEALTWLRADQRPVWLGVWSENLRAQRFYARYGFEKVAEFEFPVGDSVDLEFAMKRPAGPI